ncbi:MAG: hypothetical protein WCW13_04600, partial [archaeon]
MKSVSVEVKDKTGAGSSFFKSIGTGAGICIGVCVGIIILIVILAFLVALTTPSVKDSSNKIAGIDSNNLPISNGTTTTTVKNDFQASYLRSPVTIDGVMVKVLNAYSVNGQNNKNYYLEMSFENNGTKDVYTPSLSEVQLEDADKYVAEAGYIFSSSIDDFPSTKKLSPQQKVKGFLVFNINKSYVPVSLVLKNWNLFDNDKLVRWTILNTDIQTVDCFVDSDCSD